MNTKAVLSRACAVGVLALGTLLGQVSSAVAAPGDGETSFVDNFDTPTLNSAWQQVTFNGTRVYGYTSPANHISLTDHPGHLRYHLDPMTYSDGFWNNYQTLVATYPYDPSLELHRLFNGDHWTFETKANYHMPYTNGRGQSIHIDFGGNQAHSFRAEFVRARDVGAGSNNVSIDLLEQTGSSREYLVTRESYGTYEDIYGPDDSTYFYRLERNGGILTASWSPDGEAWTQAFSRDMGAQLDGLQQRLVITGSSWFNSAGSYADYDYVKLTAAAAAPAVTSISPSQGLLAGGTLVTVAGTGLTGATAVHFGATAATNVTVNSDTSLTATAPTGTSVGAVDVTVTTPNGTSTTSTADQYTYIYAFTGFLQPVDNPPTVNSMKAGAAVPVKFSLDGDQGLNIFATGYPVSQQVNCTTGDPIAEVEETAAAGQSVLSFDPVTGQYKYTWKTDKAWKNTCRDLRLNLADGTGHLARFTFN